MTTRSQSTEVPDTPVTVVVSGATGMIGSHLVRRLRERGDSVRRLVRHGEDRQSGDIAWNPASGVLSPEQLDGCDAIVNLAGEPIAQRWTDSRKREIRESRVRATALIARAVAGMARKPSVVLSGSAVGFYGDGGDTVLDERSVSRGGFLASVTRDWEAAAAPIAREGIRLVLLRTGMVLSRSGGALKMMLPPYKLGLGGPIGGGAQWMSWISLNDHVRAMMHALRANDLRGAVNFVAPEPVTNAEFTRALGKVLHRPAVVPVPAFALRLAFGEMADETILCGQRVAPAALTESGFVFDEPSIGQALRAALTE